MKTISAKNLRELFQSFFESKGHVRIPSSSVVPENDPTVLFTTAGMQPLVPFLLGEKHPQGTRLVDVQKCVRTDDIDEVGDTTHHTFFEMLGNWSLNDYFKQDAITWSFEFLTQTLGIPKESLAFTVFAGDDDAPFDSESEKIWLSLGVSKDRIKALPKKDNWWGPAGLTGPCGPDSEMFFWRDFSTPAPKVYDPSDKNWVEIWNDVFMQYLKDEQGKFNLSKNQNVDTGMGLERTAAVLNGLDDNYRTDLFWPIIEIIQKLSDKDYDDSNEVKVAMRVIADHLRAAVMIMSDRNGMEPSNVDQGYIVRRLLRRAIRMGNSLGISDNFLKVTAEAVFEIYAEVYPEILARRDFVMSNLDGEENKFRQTLEKGLKEFERMGFEKSISGKDAFILFTTYGFPIELTKELAVEKGLTIDLKGFDEEFKKHQELSRKGAEGKFAGGLADHSIENTRLHTATHLLHKALKTVLGDQIQQKGSNITPERLRFDFNYGEKMTPEQIKQVEDIVNEQIEKDLPVTMEEISIDEAKKKGAIGLFEDKYSDKVKVYTVRGFSMEICGGPHVAHTGELKHFKILKEESSGAGIRRIKAQVGANLK